ncbi:hypothetical protein AVEN_16967-1 [Araneus ventricosus]|uniref:Uncharacterized protein n=1 Tax=Araneus ventricosus TaxID=182803 RepID=A0A4Y2D4G5_ARAVE|nr:hypothetical protein AVEN_16967-1 [Araneus ventricosus]
MFTFRCGWFEDVNKQRVVDSFSAETAVSSKHSFLPSSNSLTLLGHTLCTKFDITKPFVDYVKHSSFAYRQFNSKFTYGNPTILAYEFIHSRNRGTVGHCPCLGVPPHNADTTGIWCTVRETALRTPLSSCDKFVKHASLLREEIG